MDETSLGSGGQSISTRVPGRCFLDTSFLCARTQRRFAGQEEQAERGRKDRMSYLYRRVRRSTIHFSLAAYPHQLLLDVSSLLNPIVPWMYKHARSFVLVPLNQINDRRNQAQTQVGRPKDHGGRVLNSNICNIGLHKLVVLKTTVDLEIVLEKTRSSIWFLLVSYW
jgi:hypothetical protein